MKFTKEIKCLCYLFKCSKYLYFAKKLLCAVTACFVIFVGLSFVVPECRASKKFREMM